MLGDISKASGYYIVCGYTDMRKAIDGLAAVIKEQYALDPFNKCLFLFCGKRRDRLKALLWEDDGFVLLYKRLENGKYKWPRSKDEARLITEKELNWLLDGLEIDQPKAIQKAEIGNIY
jgi:transposase